MGTQKIRKVFIGIFARNEADRIGNLLRDLGNQSIFSDPLIDVGVRVIANGCTDDTAIVAQKEFLREPYIHLSEEALAVEIDRPGKSNAWNEFVHSIVPRDADFLFFLDADIRIPRADALALVLQTLRSSERAVVAVDRSVKDLELQKPKTLSEWLIKASTGTANETRTAIAGALYCVRYEEVAKIWLPIGLPGEDGFLRALLLTSSFAHDEQLDRHVFIGEAYHIFESIRDAKGVIQHNVRLAIGTAINILLFGHLRSIRLREGDIAEYIRQRNGENAEWLNELVRERLTTSYFPLQLDFLIRRFQQRKRWSSPRDLGIAVFGTVFDAVVFWKATRLMRRGAGAGYW